MRLLILIACCLLPTAYYAQKDSLPYSKDFTITEGIYLSYQDFRNNQPVPKDRIISNYNRNDMNFIADVLAKDEFQYKDSTGKEHKMNCRSVWGFCNNRTVFIYHKNSFNRVPIIGNICHFTAYVYTYATHGNPYYDNTMLNTIPDLRSFMLDTKTGMVMEFLPASLETVLKRDDTLYKQYMALSKRKKRDSCFLYLRKYNEKHPLMFPSTKY